jgi:hypothetical protein
MIQPLTAETALAVNVALVAPCGTVTLAGMPMAPLLTEIPTAMFPADFDRLTIQEVLEPT